MRTKRKPKPEGPMVRVIRDSRDASRDYFILRSDAAKAYHEGKLALDVTNDAYCVVKP